MNATISRPELDQVAVAAAYEQISGSERALGDARALCFAVDAIANSPGMEREAAESLAVIAERIGELLGACEAARRNAELSLHPLVHPS